MTILNDKLQAITMAPLTMNLPGGDEVVCVKMINPVNFGPSVLKRFMAPPVPGLETFETCPSLSFIVEHPTGRKLVWDLGIRKDFNNYSPEIASYIPTTHYDIKVTDNVAEILEGHGLLQDIEGVIWRFVGPFERSTLA